MKRFRRIFLSCCVAMLVLSFGPGVKSSYQYFTSDNLGNIYLVNNEELLKYKPNGSLFARYSNLRYGDITAVDATNPLKILLYYRDYQQIVFVDNQLSENSENVALETLGLEQTELVCAGANNSFWVYNKQNNELLRFDENSKKIAATGNLKQLLGEDINPAHMLEQSNNLYLSSPQHGVFVFDVFGNYNKLIAIKDIRQFQVLDNRLYFQRDSSFCSYDHKLFEEACITFTGAQTEKGIQTGNGNVYLGCKDSVQVQKL